MKVSSEAAMCFRLIIVLRWTRQSSLQMVLGSMRLWSHSLLKCGLILVHFHGAGAEQLMGRKHLALMADVLSLIVSLCSPQDASCVTCQ